jgi:hypothetical protein
VTCYGVLVSRKRSLKRSRGRGSSAMEPCAGRNPMRRATGARRDERLQGLKVAQQRATRINGQTVEIARAEPEPLVTAHAGPKAAKLGHPSPSGRGNARDACATASAASSAGCEARHASKPPRRAAASKPASVSCRAARALVASFGQVQ